MRFRLRAIVIERGVVCAPAPPWAGRRPAAKEQRIESFLTDVLALTGEDPNAVREGCAPSSPTAK